MSPRSTGVPALGPRRSVPVSPFRRVLAPTRCPRARAADRAPGPAVHSAAWGQASWLEKPAAHLVALLDPFVELIRRRQHAVPEPEEESAAAGNLLFRRRLEETANLGGEQLS